nr:hypothetical protein [Puia sp.]
MNPFYRIVWPALLSCSSLVLTAQTPVYPPVLRNGRLTEAASLLRKKLNHSLWQSARFKQQYFLILQLNHAPDDQTRSSLKAEGIHLDLPVSARCWLATCDVQAGDSKYNNPSVSGIYVVPASIKINPALDEFLAGSKDPDNLVAISFYAGIDKITVQQEIRNAGAELVDTKIKPPHVLFIRGSRGIIDKIAKLPFVVSVDPQHLKDVPLNNNNRATHGVDALAAGLGRNLQGKGLFVGIGDNANPSTHIDFTGRLIMRTDEPVDYHGTHTSGTLAGGG